MNIWHDMDMKRITPEDFVCVIEISKGSKKKYELDKETGMIILDRILSTSMQYPANYGFIPKTYGDDNDPLDVLVLCSETIEPNTLVQCFPIGVVNMIDDGEGDEKIIAIPFGDPSLKNYKDISELPKHIFDEIEHFFIAYKALENKTTEITSIEGKDAAITVINSCIKNYADKFNK